MHPSELHTQYQHVRESLLYLAQSPRNQLHLITSWLSPFLRDGDPVPVKSYAQELTANALAILPSLSPVGGTPALLSRVRDHLLRVQALFPRMFERSEIEAGLEQIRSCERELFCWLGMPEAAGPQHLSESFERSFRGKETQRGRLDRYRAFLEAHDRNAAEQFKAVSDLWDARTRNNGGVWIPVIEQDLTHGEVPGFLHFGRMINLSATCEPREGAGAKDRFIITNHLAEGSQSDLETCLERLLAAARGTVLHTIPGDHQKAALLQITFSDPQALHTGSSFGLGLASLLACRMSSSVHARTEFHLHESMVVSGTVEEDGTVPALPEGILRDKVGTMFYSPFSSLLVPKKNEGTAQEALSSLSGRYPRRAMEIIPVRTLRDVMNHREVVELRLIPLRERLLRTVRRNQNRITIGAVSLTVLLTAFLFLFILDLDANPHSVTMKDNLYHVLNRNGRELWSRPIGPQEWPVTNEDVFIERRFLYASLVLDLDRDGRNEVLLGHYHFKRGFTDSVYCFQGDGARRWASKIGLGIRTVEKDYTSEMGFNVLGLAVIPPSREKPGKIISTSVNAFYSNVVNAFDYDGSKRAEYLHLGILMQPIVATGPVEGKECIFLSGTLNGYRQPVVVVLDPDHISGVSPQAATHRLLSPALEPAREVFYIKFPTPDLEEALLNEMNPYATIISHDDSLITVSVSHGQLPVLFKDQMPILIALIYTFDVKTMKAISVGTSTSYDRTHSSLVKKGLLSSTINDAYRQDLLDRIEYWDGDTFVRTPTMNRRYIEVAAKDVGK